MEKEDEWKEFCSNDDPLLPEPYESLDPIKKLILFKCFRPDRLLSAVEKFIQTSFGFASIKNEMFNLKSILDSSSPKTPLIYLTSKGTNAAFDILNLAYEMNMSDR